MQIRLIEKAGGKYIECLSAETPLGTEQDALDIIAICLENDIHQLLIHEEALADDFFRLGTGAAGQMLQKFINYRVKTAVIITNEQRIKGKFKELLAESNKGNDFRVFRNITEAENWLLN